MTIAQALQASHMIDGLTSELRAYCAAHGLPQRSADELAADHSVSADHREWMYAFVRRWDAAATESAEWLQALHAEVLALPVDSGCGEDCMRVIDAARALLALLDDVGPSDREGVMHAAAEQCGVFYFG
jgi:hypothetical protein